MNSKTTAHNHRSSALLIVFTGLLLGVAIGVSAYLTTSWIFNSQDFEVGQISSRIKNQLSNTSNTGSVLTGFSWFFSDELRHTDLRKLSEEIKILNQQELLDLIATSSTQPLTARLHTVQEMLFEKLVQIAPEDALVSVEQFSYTRRQSLLQIIFRNWSLLDLEQALTAVTELPRGDQQAAVRAIRAERSELSYQELSSLAGAHSFESDLAAWEQEIEFYEMLDIEPSRAFDLLARDKVEDSQQIDLYRQVVEKLFLHNGWNTLTMLGDASLSRAVFSELFEQVTRPDRGAALDFISGVNERKRVELGYQFLNSWIDENVEEAFLAVLNLPKSHFRNSMLLSVVSDWGRKDPSSTMHRLLEIPRLYRADALSSAASTLAEADPKDALERVSAVRSVPGANVDRAIQSIVNIWAVDAPKSALDWVQINTTEKSKIRNELLYRVLYPYTLIEPEQAMAVAVDEYGSDDSGYDLQSWILTALISNNMLDTAMELLDQVRDEIRPLERISIGAELVKRERMDDAFALADSVPDEEKLDYFYWVASRLTIYDRASDVLELIAKISTAELQSSVVERLINAGGAESNFTGEQLETLRSYVSD